LLAFQAVFFAETFKSFVP